LPSMRSSTRRSRWTSTALVVGSLALLVFIGGAAGLLLGRTTPHEAAAEESLSLADPHPKLAAAREIAPYAIREAVWLPDGIALTVVEWIEDREAPFGHFFAVDMIYTGTDSAYVHVWQTNTPEADLVASGKDPVSAPGFPIRIGDVGWVQGSVERQGGDVSTLSARFADGITLSIDGNVPVSDLTLIAESLAPVASP
jgi:Protein of unknown function (DUF4245)